MIELITANTGGLIAQAKELFLEYSESLGVDLGFQNFDAELENFPMQYSPPTGCLLLALSQNLPIGCVGVRYFEDGICEMKRLYVRRNFRAKHAGRLLAEAAIKAGKSLGYERMMLDTLTSMKSANQLYNSLGFVEIEPYRYNPIKGAKYLELNLKGL
jgi:ribosomal protein S18 acetylase RimI-like enzyme